MLTVTLPHDDVRPMAQETEETNAQSYIITIPY